MHMYTVSKQFTFSASHQIDGLRPGHKCGRLHGHTYTVRITVDSTMLDAVGMVMDFSAFEPIAEAVRVKYDHRHLNSAMGSNPTAENLAKEIFDIALRSVMFSLGKREDGLVTITVRVSEQPTTYAEYSETIARQSDD